MLILMGIGLALRIVACYWGVPQILHIDEQFIINPAMELIKNKTYISHVVNRPDQVEIKSVALIIYLASKIIWHSDPFAILDNHDIAFHILGRLFTTAFGVAMIPLSALIMGKIADAMDIKKRPAQIVTAVFFCFFPIYVQHSGYMTPDIPLAFGVMLFSYFFIKYLDDGKLSTLIISAIITGFCTMIKWPGLFLCTGIAFMVIYRAIQNKEYKKIFHHGIISAVTVFLTCFIIMPNIISDFPVIMEYMHIESQPRNISGTRLEMFFMNFTFYVKTVVSGMGVITLIPFTIGVIGLVKNKVKYGLMFVVGGLYWFIISSIPVQWIRWGTPIYLYYMIMVGIGIFYGIKIFKEKKLINIIYLCITGIIILNSVLSGLSMTRYVSLPNVCLIGRNDLEAMGITAYNTMSEWQTPFATWYGTRYTDCFVIDDEGHATVKEDYEKVRDYFVRYDPNESDFYTAIENSFPLVYSIYPDGNYEQKPLALWNIAYSAYYLTTDDIHVGGWPIWVYKVR